jgi:hypothetical protein
METLGVLIFGISFLAIPVLIIMGLVSLFKKNGKAKRRFLWAVGAFVLMIIGGNIMDAAEENATETAATVNEEVKDEVKGETSEEKAAREAEEKAEAEAKAKAEEEQKAKEEAEGKAKAEEEAKKAEEARIAAEKEAAEKKANAKPMEYAQLKKNPNRHAGTYVKYTGEILQIQEGDGFTVIRLAVTKDSYGYNPNDVIWVEYLGYTDFVDEDIVTVYGEIMGEHSYTSQAGWDITIPSMFADSIE